MILNRQRAVRVPRRPLDLFVRQVRDALGLADAEIAICLVSDREIARMNETYRKKKGPTDVLSFAAGRGKRPRSLRRAKLTRVKRQLPTKQGREPDFLGDIAISPATAQRNAKSMGRTASSELRVLILHGILHLLGYDHETDHGEMERLEQRLRQKFGLV